MAYINLPGTTTLLNVNHTPETCPFCHCEINPQYISSHFHQQDGIKEYAILCSCPVPSCGKFFTASYNWDLYSNSWELAGISFDNPLEIQLSPLISGISKNFSAIYDQSIKAEQSNLKELCWLGYSEALDILVRDFLISRFPSDAPILSDLPLIYCINDYINDERIKEIARRTGFRGNNNFFTLPKDEEINPEEVKRLIQIILRWIEIEASAGIPLMEDPV